MSTGLWVATCGLAPGAIAAAVPPACRRPVDAPAALVTDGDDVLAQSPDWSVGGATQLLPSFSALTERPLAMRFEVAARIGGAWTPWTAGITLGDARFAPLPPSPSIEADVDVFRAPAALDAVRVRVRLRAPAPTLRATPWMLTLSASDGAAPPPAGPAAPARLDVPALSQLETAPALARRICSPTCVAMVLRYWRCAASPESLAAEMFHAATDLYGVWPAAIAAAARHGVAGYLLRFPDWASAAWCLQQGLPIIASVRYAAGELAGAAIATTAGHLLVLTGVDGDAVLVNDPAAPTAAAVPRRYRTAELARVWLERTGVGYVLFAPPRLRAG